MSEQNAFYKLRSVGGFREEKGGVSRGPHETVRPQTVEYSSSWLNFLIVICLLVAWFFPLRILISYWVWPTVDRGPLDSYEFVALTYEGVSDKETHVSPNQFKEHLDALIESGYNPITLAEIRAMYEDGEPLPRKAVLLSFDHSRRSSFFETRTPIRRTGWSAALFLWTRPIEDMDRATILWPYLRAMLRGGSWEVGAQSHDGFQKAHGADGEVLGNYLTSPIWLPDSGRYENFEEFYARLARDHERSISLIRDKLNVEPIAYAYPYGDFGQFRSTSSVIHAVNLALVENNYDLGFLTGNLAMNTRHSDPRRLNRLLVNPDWSGQDLVDRLERSWPVADLAIDTQPAAELPWILDWGDSEQNLDGSVDLFASPQATGSKMWLAGSDLSRDFYAKIRFTLEHGQLDLYMRATPDSESYVYLGLDARGDVWLRQLRPGEDDDYEENNNEQEVATSDAWLRQKEVTSERFTVASANVNIEPRREHTVEVYLRENMLFARIDDGPVFGQRAMLRGEQRPGMLGLSVWAPEQGAARVKIRDVEFRRPEKIMLSWNGQDSTKDPYMFKWVHDNAYRLTHISPKWLAVDSLGQVRQSDIDFDSYRLLSRINHLRIYPEINLIDNMNLSSLRPQTVATRAAMVDVDGVFLDMNSIQDPVQNRVANWVKDCAEMLQERGMELLVRLPFELETASVLSSMLATIPNARAVLDSNSALVDDPELDREKILTRESIAPPESNDDVPLFYEITGDVGPFEETIESRSDRLYEEGMEAFQEGEYDVAYSLWRELLGINPNEPRVLMLLGDVETRRGNTAAAVDYYDRSLEIDPGQISLQIRRARLLEAIGRDEEALRTLNLYSRLFPENSEILIAQAEWLERNDRVMEAMDISRSVLELDPENLRALSMIFRYCSQYEERIGSLERLVELGQEPQRQLELGRLIWNYELFTSPESGPLMRLARDIADTTPDPQVREIFQRFSPRYSTVRENFEGSELNENWWVVGGRISGQRNAGLLRASNTHREISMRLLGSLQWRNAFIETTVSDVQGDFWIYTSRSEEHLVRFGFTREERLHLQVWRRGRLVSNQNKPFPRPTRPVKLRLDICGDGVIGYVDGEVAFTPYANLPQDIAQGWVGVAVNHSDLGRASARVHNIVAGPSPARIAILDPVHSDEDIDAQLQLIRRGFDALTALSPIWFSVDSSGAWRETFSGDKQLYRLFARYNRFWLMPIVEIVSAENIEIERLLANADRYNADGFILMLETWPSDSWIANFEVALRESGLKVILARVGSEAERIQMLGLGPARAVFSNRHEPVSFPLLSGEDIEDASGYDNRNNPMIIRL